MQHKEFDLQKQVCAYLRVKYPKVLFLSDTVASVKLTIPQAARNKAIQKEGFKTPDLIIFEPKLHHSCLFLELKTKSPFKKGFEGIEVLKSQNDHLQKQYETLCDLQVLGYYAVFAWSFEMACEIIDTYMNLPDKELKF